MVHLISTHDDGASPLHTWMVHRISTHSPCVLSCDCCSFLVAAVPLLLLQSHRSHNKGTAVPLLWMLCCGCKGTAAFVVAAVALDRDRSTSLRYIEVLAHLSHLESCVSLRVMCHVEWCVSRRMMCVTYMCTLTERHIHICAAPPPCCAQLSWMFHAYACHMKCPKWLGIRTSLEESPRE